MNMKKSKLVGMICCYSSKTVPLYCVRIPLAFVTTSTVCICDYINIQGRGVEVISPVLGMSHFIGGEVFNKGVGFKV